jgi:S-DNA-T family DNA segregation ATPase FtsK/SpoIIIE
MQIYEKLPHLAFPVVTDPKKVLLALRWLNDEIDRRYKIFARIGVRNITSFNARPKKKTQPELDADAVAGVDDPGSSATRAVPAGVNDPGYNAAWRIRFSRPR